MMLTLILNNQYVGHTEKIHEIPITFEDGKNTLLAIDEHEQNL